jgi:hypothetical protein
MTPRAAAAAAAMAKTTPKHKSGIKPAGEEMHPAHHQQSTSKPYDEARWLGFFNMKAPNTEPAKKSAAIASSVPMSPTPVKVNRLGTPSGIAAPDFNFTVKNPPAELSPEARKMLDDSRAEATRIRKQMVEAGNVPGIASMVELAGRKIATPKGKLGRFSDAHSAVFNKMESIADHPSKWRMDPTRATSTKSLKRSPSKTELDQPIATKSLKRSPSKADLDAPRNSAASLRTPQKATSMTSQSVSMTPTPVAKRVKHSKEDDATTSRQKEPEQVVSKIPTTPRSIQGLRAHFQSPTKSAMARRLSNRPAKNTQIPTLVRSKSAMNLPALSAVAPKETTKNTGVTLITGAAAGTHEPAAAESRQFETPKKAASKLPQKIRSILRTPHRLYSHDPSKIAAGTHLATPPDGRKTLIPATEPVRKHVDFSASTKEKADRDEAKDPSVEPEPEPALYPVLVLTAIATTKVEDDRRSTISMPPKSDAFTFRSPMPAHFPPSNSTIRPVRGSDVGIHSPPKRKLEAMLTSVGEDESSLSDKENSHNLPADVDEHQSKKMRKLNPAADDEKPVAKRPAPMVQTIKKAADRAFKSASSATRTSRGLTASRLNFLSQPKKRN